MKAHSLSLIIVLSIVASSSSAVAQQASNDDVPSRIRSLEQWLSAIETHRPGAFDESVRLIGSWKREQLQQIWVDVRNLVILVRAPQTLFFTSLPLRRSVLDRGGPGRLGSPETDWPDNVPLYSSRELRELRRLAKVVSPDDKPGPLNDMLTRGALLHTDIEILIPLEKRPTSDSSREGPGGATLLLDDGRQRGLLETVSHWNMGRRLLDEVWLYGRNGPEPADGPEADDTVRRFYLAGCAHMLRIRRIETAYFSHALALFPNDPDLLFFAASAHEMFAGARMQAVMRSLKVPRDVSFDVHDAASELRLAEQLYRRALERNPTLIEARIRLGRVLGQRGRHDEAVAQLKQGLSATEPLLQYYANLFLGGEYEALENGAEARQSYERASALDPTAQSPWLGLSRVADRAGDRAAARAAVDRVFQLPSSEPERGDPWWVYETAQARQADRLVSELRQQF
jgi:tetratricopeptide (TPR) repeat protein